MASKASSSRLKRAFVTTFKVGLYGGLLAAITVVIAVAVAISSLPSYQELVRRDDLGQMIQVHAADGSVMMSLGPSFGDWLRYDEIPPIMRTALIAVEDRRFRSHPGVDPIGIVRGIWISMTAGGQVRGVSTISQQLARNIFLTNDRSFGRKVREGILALAIERRFSKDQVLELYLNRVYFGGGAYGIDAAARRFFGHSARQLSLPEAAIIAGLVKAPSNYSPTADVEAAKGRAGVVIQLMADHGFITPDEAAGADPDTVKVVPVPRQNSVRYFTDWVLPQLDTLIDETVQPIEVWTTLDVNMQKLGDQAINGNTPAGAQGAMVSLDRDGAIRAMVGGRDYVSSIYNRATQATRQPGSAFKLFVYLAALEAGVKPDDMIKDEPITINGWSPRNNSRSYAGSISIRQAFARSINTVSARLGQQVSFRAVADMAQRMGITTRVNTQPAMVLGTSEVRLIDMTRAFASVARKGAAVVPYGITKVTTSDGHLLYRHTDNESRVLLTPWVAAEMTDLLQTAVLAGSGGAAQIGRPVAGKTGTTTSNKDGWFIGFSSGLTTGVWMGRDDARTVPGLQGGRAPARAFHDFMVQAVAKRPVEQFETKVTLPDWQQEPDEESWLGEPVGGSGGMMVDPDGNPLPSSDPNAAPFPDPYGSRDNERMDQQWIERQIAPRAPPPSQPRPRNDNATPPRGSTRELDPAETL
jgi:penicillin-binding protein 1A